MFNNVVPVASPLGVPPENGITHTSHYGNCEYDELLYALRMSYVYYKLIPGAGKMV